MDELGIDPQIDQCVFNKTMPTTANRAVWAAVSGGVYAQDPGPGATTKQQLDFLSFAGDMRNVLVAANAGVGWGATNSVTSGAGGTLGPQLFNLLKGKNILHPSGSNITIGVEADLNLNDTSREDLKYFDPALFPSVFGELPSDTFNVTQ